jgi:FkbM family methyltransferase
MFPVEHVPMREITFRNIRFNVNDQNSKFWDMLSVGQWEESTFGAIDSQIDADTTFLDFGAWIGPVTLYASTKALRVISFEPDPVAASRLRENVALNPALASKITIVERAVSSTPGALTMGARNAQGDSMSSVMNVNSDMRWSVQAVTPDEIARMVPADAPLFLKIDVEGAEYELAPSLAPLLSRAKVAALISFHPRIAAGDHFRWHKTFPMTQRVFRAFRGFRVNRVVGHSNFVRRARFVESLSKVSSAYFEAKATYLFVKPNG